MPKHSRQPTHNFKRLVRGPVGWLLLVAVLLIAFIFGPYFLSRFLSPYRAIRVVNSTSQQQSIQSNELSVFVMNIAHGRGDTDSNLEESGPAKRNRVKQIAALIRKYNPDIVVLNEVDFSASWSGHVNQAELIAHEAGYPHLTEQRNFDFGFAFSELAFGNAILSRHPIAQAELIGYPPVNRWEPWVCGQKRGVVTTLKLSDTIDLDIVAVHLEPRGEAVRVQSLASIFKSLDLNSGRPIILAGDFNSTPSTFPHSGKDENGNNAIDNLLSHNAGFHTPLTIASPECFTFPSSHPIKTIDWVFVSPDLEFTEYTVIQSDLSDHLPLFAKVKLPTPASSD